MHPSTGREPSALLSPAKPGEGWDGGRALAIAAHGCHHDVNNHLQPGPEAA